MSLFQLGDFTLHAGGKSEFKIDCDALTEEDMKVLAYAIAEKVKFSNIIGIPRGGLRLAEALKSYWTKTARLTLIVDDVLTTGRSMEEMRAQVPEPSLGFVIFARGPLPAWVSAIFKTEMF